MISPLPIPMDLLTWRACEVTARADRRTYRAGNVSLEGSSPVEKEEDMTGVNLAWGGGEEERRQQQQQPFWDQRTTDTKAVLVLETDRVPVTGVTGADQPRHLHTFTSQRGCPPPGQDAERGPGPLGTGRGAESSCASSSMQECS